MKRTQTPFHGVRRRVRRLKDGETLAVGSDGEGLVLGDRARGATQGASAPVH